jgi:osmoprotectant transport system ATP-binding protein
MIEVSHLTKKFGDLTAVKGVSFSVSTGKTLALVGTSGCGKTTTLKMINRLIEPTEGQVLVNGEDIMSYAPETMRRKIGYVIQNIGLFPHFTIEENVALVPKLLDWDVAKTKKRVYELLERLKLSPEKFVDRYPHELSGGQRQRVGIARALAGDPPIVLMDEPFGALDPITRRAVRADFRELEELSSKTVIIVTHDIEEAFEMADTVCILDKGFIQQIDSPKGLLFRPANDFVRQFLSNKLLQLEFQTIRVADLFEELPESENHPANSIEIKADCSIFEAMAELTRFSKSQSSAYTTINDQRKTYDLNSLMDVFYRTLSDWKKSA